MSLGGLKKAGLLLLACIVTTIFSFAEYHHASSAGDPSHDEAHCELCVASHVLAACSSTSVAIIIILTARTVFQFFFLYKSFITAKRFEFYSALAPPAFWAV